MFLTLLALTLGVSLLTAGLVVLLFRRPIGQILDRIVGESIAGAWQRYLVFALFVVGVSAGAQIWKLEQYVHPEPAGPNGVARTLTLDTASLALEAYRTIIQVLQGMAWALLVFFAVALIAFAVVRRAESRTPPPAARD
jgi:hypothetical protein